MSKLWMSNHHYLHADSASHHCWFYHNLSPIEPQKMFRVWILVESLTFPHERRKVSVRWRWNTMCKEIRLNENKDFIFTLYHKQCQTLNQKCFWGWHNDFNISSLIIQLHPYHVFDIISETSGQNIIHSFY